MTIDVSTTSHLPPQVAAAQAAQAHAAQAQVAERAAAATAAVESDAVSEIHKTLKELATVSAVFERRLSFHINEKLGQMVVKVIDRETERTIREIPAELQHVRERIREVIGILFDEQA